MESTPPPLPKPKFSFARPVKRPEGAAAVTTEKPIIRQVTAAEVKAREKQERLATSPTAVRTFQQKSWFTAEDSAKFGEAQVEAFNKLMNDLMNGVEQEMMTKYSQQNYGQVLRNLAMHLVKHPQLSELVNDDVMREVLAASRKAYNITYHNASGHALQRAANREAIDQFAALADEPSGDILDVKV